VSLGTWVVVGAMWCRGCRSVRGTNNVNHLVDVVPIAPVSCGQPCPVFCGTMSGRRVQEVEGEEGEC
jgi:hypothetical protein